MKAVSGTITAFLSEKQKSGSIGKKGSQIKACNLLAYYDCLEEVRILLITVSFSRAVRHVHLPVTFKYCIFFPAWVSPPNLCLHD